MRQFRRLQFSLFGKYFDAGVEVDFTERISGFRSNLKLQRKKAVGELPAFRYQFAIQESGDYRDR